MPRRCGCWYDQQVGSHASLGIHVDIGRKNVGLFFGWWTIWLGWMYRSGRDGMAAGRVGRR